MNTARKKNGKRQTRYYVYVWEFPVRLFHWVNALCIFALGITGYLIGRPIALASAAEASGQYWFGTMRFVHFATAYVWVIVAVLRIYWGFVGNEHVRFKNFLPFRREQWREIKYVIQCDVLQVWKGATFNIGHNALAGATYTLAFAVFLFQAATGFGLYAAMSGAWFPDLFAWIVPLMGGDHAVRLWHHAMLWVFAVFVLIHVYLSAYHDYVEATGTISSMVGGWKFAREQEPPSIGPRRIPPVEAENV